MLLGKSYGKIQLPNQNERFIRITMTIGEKIRSLRLAKGLTQAAICGDTITRNMLSRIENGAALPSVTTLQELSRRLGVSAGYFLDEIDDPFPYLKTAMMPPIKEAFRTQRYAACLEMIASLPKDDELRFIEAYSFLALGSETYRKGHLTSAEHFFKAAIAAAEETLYDSKMLKQKGEYYLSLIRRAKENKLPELSIADGSIFGETIEYYLYLYMLNVTKNTRYDLAASIYDTLKFSSTLFRKHINARLSLLARNPSRAVALLSELIEEMKAGDCDPVFAVNVLADSEAAASALGNYEAAYQTLRQKNELLENFQK